MNNQEASVVETTSGNDAVLLVKIEEMIKTHLSQIDQLAEEVSNHKDIY